MSFESETEGNHLIVECDASFQMRVPLLWCHGTAARRPILNPLTPTIRKHLFPRCPQRTYTRAMPSSTKTSTSSATDKTTEDPIDFPWQLKSSPPRVTGPQIQRSAFASYILDPMKLEIQQMIAQKYVHHAYGQSYAENEFIAGASFALTKLCETLSSTDPPGVRDEALRALLTRPVYNRISAGLERLTERGEVLSVNVTLHDVQIRAYHVMFGPPLGEAVMAKRKLLRHQDDGRYYSLGEDWVMFRGLTAGTTLPEAVEREGAAKVRQYRTEAMSEGAIISLEVVFEADVAFSIRRQKQEGNEENDSMVFAEECRRDIVVLFEGRHMSQEDARDGSALSNKPDRHWRISDVDNLVESSLYEDFLKRNPTMRAKRSEESRDSATKTKPGQANKPSVVTLALILIGTSALLTSLKRYMISERERAKGENDDIMKRVNLDLEKHLHKHGEPHDE
ncbi:hypothetical protein DFJ77DRAFT_456647 [Powellomyces hirtus]|nr:hypothetical protein DFJ77DRAFT_456647 [Powellomyces hirtus]